MVASLVLFLISQISWLSWKKYIIFHSINPIPDFTIRFASPEKERIILLQSERTSIEISEADVQIYSVKKMFLEISQNSQENTRVSS